MINLLFLAGCFTHVKDNIEYIKIGIVDRVENDICTIEIDKALFFEYSPNTIYIYSKNCNEGDIIILGRKNESR